MNNLLIKFKDIIIRNYVNFNNKLTKFYLYSFYILNITYLCLEISKNNLYKLFYAHADQQKYYFDKISNISFFTTSIASLLLIINILYLIFILIKYRSKKDTGLNEYLIVSVISLLSIKLVNLILLAIFSTNYLLEQNIGVYQITIIVLVVTLIKRAYKYLLSKNKRAVKAKSE